MGDSYELQIRFMLAKFVFVKLQYPGWVGLTQHVPSRSSVSRLSTKCASIGSG